MGIVGRRYVLSTFNQKISLQLKNEARNLKGKGRKESSLWRPKKKKWKERRADLSKWELVLQKKKGRVLNRARKTGCGETRTDIAE